MGLSSRARPIRESRLWRVGIPTGRLAIIIIIISSIIVIIVTMNYDYYY